ncbi:MAG: helix-turn-helix transcriptional regulator [Kiloniellales bacterium]|jgi:transcriptional regulator with XRE-family HTH domain|nr:helix-turn-helix transcriptional regulator [Kiloniellales bacterium]
MDRREIVEVFRERLGEVIRRTSRSRSAFANEIGLDRSTLSQLLSSEHARLPRAETIAAIARRAQVSVDWLLGLSQEGQLGADMLSQALDLEIEPGSGSPADERLKRWHAEAAGYKIRYVPSTLPDLLKTEAVIRYEFQLQDTRLPRVRLEEAERRLAYSRRPETDMEVCSSVQSLAGFARGEGIWSGLPAADRRDQIERMIQTLDELYPTLRWFLFDGLKSYCVPMTVFGPLRAAVYIGDMYLVLNSTEHIRELTSRFDNLIRAAVVQPPEVVVRLEALRREL